MTKLEQPVGGVRRPITFALVVMLVCGMVVLSERDARAANNSDALVKLAQADPRFKNLGSSCAL